MSEVCRPEAFEPAAAATELVYHRRNEHYRTGEPAEPPPPGNVGAESEAHLCVVSRDDPVDQEADHVGQYTDGDPTGEEPAVKAPGVQPQDCESHHEPDAKNRR